MTGLMAGTTGLIDPAELSERLGLRRPTDEQAEVIAAPFASALVTAGAGSGKTETMAARVVWLVANGIVTPDQVLGLTFTRKAAGQLADRIRRRLRRLAGDPLLDELDPTGERRVLVRTLEPTVSTYHAYAGRLLTEHGLRLPTDPGPASSRPTASWQLAHRVVSSWTRDLDTALIPTSVTGYVLALAGELGEHLAEPDQLREHAEALARVVESAPPAKGQRPALPQALTKIVERQRFRVALLPLVEELAARKRTERCLDFADQMAAAARLADAHPEVGQAERGAFRAVLLDEYQDTGHAQRIMLRALFGGDEQTAVTAVGDPFQSIYGWRGASAANLPRFVTDFPRPDREGEWVAARRFGLLTSFRNPPEVLALANGVVEPLREPRSLDGVDELRAFTGAAPGDVRVALHPDVEAERTWLADAVADRWRAALDRGDPPPTSAVLVRRRADMTELAAALRARDLPVEVVGLGGLLDEPEVRDLVSALRLVVDPLAGGAAVRLLTGARWRIGGADLAALWRRARELAAPPIPETAPTAGAPDPVADALPGEHAERAGLVDALDDPGPAEHYSPAGYARLRRLARELVGLRRRVTAPLVDLVADVERTLLLDVESASRPGEVGRAHLDAFADVVADFAGGAATSGGTATPTALLSYLDAAEEAEDGLTPGEVESTAGADPALGGARVQVLTVHAAKGLEWEVVGVPHVCAKIFPAAEAVRLVADEHRLAARRAARRPAGPPGARRRRRRRPQGAHRAPGPPRAGVRRPAARRGAPAVLRRAHPGGADPAGVRALVGRVRREAPRAVGLPHRDRRGRTPGWGDGGRAGPTRPRRARRTRSPRSSARRPGRSTRSVPAATRSRRGRRWSARRAHGWRRPPTRPSRSTTPADASRRPMPRRPMPRRPMPRRPMTATSDPDGWAADVDVLLAERAAARERHARVLLPPQLSVSQLVDLAADPDALARRLRRPVPRPPDPRARRGTEFHAWVERWFAKTELLEFDELPGAADEDPATDDAASADLTELQDRFTASAWANRTPVAVEVPFETEVEGTLVRGRIDAVFVDRDGGATVVDWKTGAPPAPEAMPALSVQLAAYRLAWAALSGTPVERVRAALHYVRADRTVTPSDLLDAGGLRALVASVPVEVREPEGDDVVVHRGPPAPWTEDDADPDRTGFDDGDRDPR